MFFNKAVPEIDLGYRHGTVVSYDIPAHLKSALLRSSVMIPITNGVLALGQWQGVYLGEKRDHAKTKLIVCTIWGV